MQHCSGVSEYLNNNFKEKVVTSLQQCLLKRPNNSIRFIAESIMKHDETLNCTKFSNFDEQINNHTFVNINFNDEVSYELTKLYESCTNSTLNSLSGVPIYKLLNPNKFEIDQLLEHIHGMLSVERENSQYNYPIGKQEGEQASTLTMSSTHAKKIICESKIADSNDTSGNCGDNNNNINNSNNNNNEVAQHRISTELVVIVELPPEELVALYIRNFLYRVKRLVKKTLTNQNSNCEKLINKSVVTSSYKNDKNNNKGIAYESRKSASINSERYESVDSSQCFSKDVLETDLRILFGQEHVENVCEAIAHSIRNIFGDSLTIIKPEREEHVNTVNVTNNLHSRVNMFVLPSAKWNCCTLFDVIDSAFLLSCNTYQNNELLQKQERTTTTTTAAAAAAAELSSHLASNNFTNVHHTYLPHVLFISYNKEKWSLTFSRILPSYLPWVENCKLHKLHCIAEDNIRQVRKYNLHYIQSYWRDVLERRQLRDQKRIPASLEKIKNEKVKEVVNNTGLSEKNKLESLSSSSSSSSKLSKRAAREGKEKAAPMPLTAATTARIKKQKTSPITKATDIIESSKTKEEELSEEPKVQEKECATKEITHLGVQERSNIAIQYNNYKSPSHLATKTNTNRNSTLNKNKIGTNNFKNIVPNSVKTSHSSTLVQVVEQTRSLKSNNVSLDEMRHERRRVLRRQDEDLQFLHVVYVLQTQAAVRIQATYRGYRVRRTFTSLLQYNAPKMHSTTSFLTNPYDALLPPLLRLTLEEISMVHGDIFGNYKVSPLPQSRMVKVYKPLRRVAHSHPSQRTTTNYAKMRNNICNSSTPCMNKDDDDDDTDSKNNENNQYNTSNEELEKQEESEEEEELLKDHNEESDSEVEEWDVAEVSLPPRRLWQPRTRSNLLARLLEYHELAECNIIDEAMRLQRSFTGFSLLQKMSYNKLKAVMLSLLHLAKTELFHRGLLNNAERISLLAFIQRFHARLFDWLSSPHITSLQARQLFTRVLSTPASSALNSTIMQNKRTAHGRISVTSHRNEATCRSESSKKLTLPLITFNERILQYERMLMHANITTPFYYFSLESLPICKMSVTRAVTTEAEAGVVAASAKLRTDHHSLLVELTPQVYVTLSMPFLTKPEIHLALAELKKESKSESCVHWWSLSEEPCVYVNGKPFILFTRQNRFSVEGQREYNEYEMKVIDFSKCSKDDTFSTNNTILEHCGVNNCKKEENNTTHVNPVSCVHDISVGECINDEMRLVQYLHMQLTKCDNNNSLTVYEEKAHSVNNTNNCEEEREHECEQEEEEERWHEHYGKVQFIRRSEVVDVKTVELSTPDDVFNNVNMCLTEIQNKTAEAVDEPAGNVNIAHKIKYKDVESETTVRVTHRRWQMFCAPFISWVNKFEELVYATLECLLINPINEQRLVIGALTQTQIVLVTSVTLISNAIQTSLNGTNKTSQVSTITEKSNMTMQSAFTEYHSSTCVNNTITNNNNKNNNNNSNDKRSEKDICCNQTQKQKDTNITERAITFLSSFHEILATKFIGEKVNVQECIATLYDVLETIHARTQTESLITMIGVHLVKAEKEKRDGIINDFARKRCANHILSALRLTEWYCCLLSLQIWLSLPQNRNALHAHTSKSSSQGELNQHIIETTGSSMFRSFQSFIAASGVMKWAEDADPWIECPTNSPDSNHVRYSHMLRRWDKDDYIAFAIL